MKNREWIKEGAVRGEVFMLVTRPNEIDAANAAGIGGRWTFLS
jgi:hypothetical protein